MDTFPRPDLLIVARGGGLGEGLWVAQRRGVCPGLRGTGGDHPDIRYVGHETRHQLIRLRSDGGRQTQSRRGRDRDPLVLSDCASRVRSGAGGGTGAGSRLIDDGARGVEGRRERPGGPSEEWWPGTAAARSMRSRVWHRGPEGKAPCMSGASHRRRLEAAPWDRAIEKDAATGWEGGPEPASGAALQANPPLTNVDCCASLPG